MPATNPPSGDSPKIDEFVDRLIGPGVDAPEIKAVLLQMMTPTFDVIYGKRTGIDFIVDDSGVGERDVIDVLWALQSMPMPEVVVRRLAVHGFAQEDIPKVIIGVKRVAMAFVSQHSGLLAGVERDE